MNPLSAARHVVDFCFFSLLILLSSIVSAATTPQIFNGSFTGPVNTDTTTPNAAPGWTVVNATPEVVGATAPTNNTGIPWTLSPDGGTFAKLNGTFDPVYREAIQQNVVTGFTPGATYQLNFYATNLGFYFSRAPAEWYNHEGYFEFFLDDVSLGISPLLRGPSQYDEPVQWSQGSISFVATNATHSLKIGSRTTATAADPSGSSPTTAYVAIDGLWFTREDCGNGTDDDLDGLVDDDDEDCQTPPGPAGSFSTRCLHKPLYPQDGEDITIFVDTIDLDGNTVEVDTIEVYINNRNQPHTVASGPLSSTQVTYTGSGTRLFYGCRATRDDGSVAFTGYRTADIGIPENKDWAAVPVVYHGPMDEKVDLVFFAEEDAYVAGALDPAFQEEMYEMVFDGLLEIPWYVRNFESFNVWLALDQAGVEPKNASDASKKCKKDKPARFKKKYGFADAAGIIHKEACRDNAAFKTFSTAYRGHRLQVVAHEIGHAAFSLSDEYEGKTVYFTLPDVPNVLPSQGSCIASAQARNKDASACRAINGGLAGLWWIFEPVYRNEADLLNETGDLMQQTGFGDTCTSPEGDQLACARYRIGDSEIDRMTWKLGKCRDGRC